MMDRALTSSCATRNIVAREALIDVLQRRKAMLAEEFKKGREITVGIACEQVLPSS